MCKSILYQESKRGELSRILFWISFLFFLFVFDREEIKFVLYVILLLPIWIPMICEVIWVKGNGLLLLLVLLLLVLLLLLLLLLLFVWSLLLLISFFEVSFFIVSNNGFLLITVNRAPKFDLLVFSAVDWSLA